MTSKPELDGRLLIEPLLLPWASSNSRIFISVRRPETIADLPVTLSIVSFRRRYVEHVPHQCQRVLGWILRYMGSFSYVGVGCSVDVIPVRR